LRIMDTRTGGWEAVAQDPRNRVRADRSRAVRRVVTALGPWQETDARLPFSYPSVASSDRSRSRPVKPARRQDTIVEQSELSQAHRVGFHLRPSVPKQTPSPSVAPERPDRPSSTPGLTREEQGIAPVPSHVCYITLAAASHATGHAQTISSMVPGGSSVRRSDRATIVTGSVIPPHRPPGVGSPVPRSGPTGGVFSETRTSRVVV